MSKDVLNLSSGFCLSHEEPFDNVRSKVDRNERRSVFLEFLFQIEILVPVIGIFAMRSVGRSSIMSMYERPGRT